jgi:hypothetical protein
VRGAHLLMPWRWCVCVCVCVKLAGATQRIRLPGGG